MKIKTQTNLDNYNDQSLQLMFSHFNKYYCLHRQQLKQPHRRHRSTSTFSSMVLGVMSTMMLLLMLVLLPIYCVDAVGYSYTRFVGPVAGPEHKIYVNDVNTAADGKAQHRGSGAPRLDYIAKPEYEFAYGVEDADAHILHNRNEMRDGDAVKGVYSLVDPDGALRVVKYTADDVNGFQAEVIRNGVSSLHGQLQYDYKRVPPSSNINHHNNYYNLDREHLKGDYDKYYSSSKPAYTPNLEQLQQVNHNLQSHYQSPPQPPIIYHYNSDETEDDSGSSNASNNDYHDDRQPQYEVHEKSNNDDHENGNDDDDHYDEDDNDHKSNKDDSVGGYKKEKHPEENDDDDDDDEDDDECDDEKNSEEWENYDEAVHSSNKSEESDEYY